MGPGAGRKPFGSNVVAPNPAIERMAFGAAHFYIRPPQMMDRDDGAAQFADYSFGSRISNREIGPSMIVRTIVGGVA